MHASWSYLSVSPVLSLEPYDWIAGLMSTFTPPWFVCGGWAVDAWLGRQTREHGDFDITVFQHDQRALFDHLASWNLIAHDPNVAGAATEPWDGRTLDLPAHIHARPGGTRNRELLEAWVRTPGSRSRDGQDLEIILNQRDGNRWVLDEESLVSLPVDKSYRQALGVPVAVPEALMFFKATAYRGVPGYPRAHDEADFVALLPLLSGGRRAWLERAIARTSPAHPWLSSFGT